MEKKKVAVMVADVSHKGFAGKAIVFRCSPAVDGHELIVCSAVVAMFSGAETYAFACDEDGNVRDFSELSISRRGILDPAKILELAGYEVKV